MEIAKDLVALLVLLSVLVPVWLLADTMNRPDAPLTGAHGLLVVWVWTVTEFLGKIAKEDKAAIEAGK